MKLTRMKLMVAALVAFALACVSSYAPAQPSGAVQSIAPLTRNLSTVQTLTARTAATVTSSDQTGYNVSRVVCAFNMSTYTGTPSVTFKVQNKDAASGLYYDIITSPAITALATPTPIAFGAGLVASAGVSAAMPVATAWRTSVTVGGTSTPVVTGTVGCSVQ